MSRPPRCDRDPGPGPVVISSARQSRQSSSLVPFAAQLVSPQYARQTSQMQNEGDLYQYKDYTYASILTLHLVPTPTALGLRPPHSTTSSLQHPLLSGLVLV